MLPERGTRAWRAILGIHFRGMPLQKGVDLDDLAERTSNWSGAELAAVAHEAAMLAVREYVEGGKDPADERALKKATVTKEHGEAAFRKTAQRSGHPTHEVVKGKAVG